MVCNVRIMEVDMFKELLPIGSVVLLKGGIKKIMVTGIKPVSKDDDGTEQEYDYIGVIYPEGYLNDEFNFLFNHSDVNDVVFRGYENPERVEFIEYMEEVLKRYYKGETTLAEERELRSAWQRGELPGEPILGLRDPMEIPEGLNEKLQRYIRQKRQRKIRQLWITAGSIAAMAVLILSFRGTFTTTPRPGIQLSDNLKKERFENALRVLGNALEDEKTPVQRVLYEDHNLIIAIE